MTDDELLHYRVDQLESKVNKIEKMIFGALISVAGFGLSILWLLMDLPSKIQTPRYETKNSQTNS
jgi:hypothetical protein